MNNRTIPILSAVMTISFIILVALQFYFFKQILRKSEDDFSVKVNRSLENTSKKIRDSEIQKYYKLFGNFYDEATESDIYRRQEISAIIDSGDYRLIEFKNYLIEKKEIPVPFSLGDTLTNTKVYTDEGSVKVKKDSTLENPSELSQQIETDLESGEFSLKNFAKLNSTNKPIQNRINLTQIRNILQSEFNARQIETPFDIAILDDTMKPTVLKDSMYSTQIGKNYKSILFTKDDDTPQYFLSIYFPNKNASVFKPFLWPIAITLLTTLVVILIYGTSIYFMSRQKKISAIKTDFINNMTHEFKTPIATISIATDALKNQTVINNPEKIDYYANLIKSENQRMNKQVEMILRMTKLENNQLILETKELKVNDIVHSAVESMRAVVEDRNGTIIEDLNTADVYVDGDNFHLVNSIINLIDNANKYTPENPRIEVKSYQESGYALIKVIDNGIGMQPLNLTKIFDKFYREETGNVHNVKGHGLGLTYVKNIIEKHGGEITVDSRPGKGSTFTVKLPIKEQTYE